MPLGDSCCYLVPVGFGGYLREILTTRGFGLRLLAVESRYREQVRAVDGHTSRRYAKVQVGRPPICAVMGGQL